MSSSLPKHILVIRMSAMGDIAITVPVLRSLINEYPDVRITYVTRPFFSPIVAYIPNTTILPAKLDEEHKGISGLYQLAKQAKQNGVDTVIDLHGVLRSHMMKAYFTLSGIPVYQIDKGRKEKRTLVRAENKTIKPLKPTYERYAEVLRKAGFDFNIEPSTALIPRQKMSEAVLNLIGSQTGKWIGIAPFAQHPGKEYPLEKIKAVANQLIQQDYSVFLFGGGDKEKNLLDTLAKDQTKILNCTYKFTFAEEIQLISNLDLMISMDSGNGHLAALFGIPVLTLWGVTHPYAGFAPYGQPHQHQLLPDRDTYPLLPVSIYGKHNVPNYDEAISSISPKLIVEKVNTILN